MTLATIEYRVRSAVSDFGNVTPVVGDTAEAKKKKKNPALATRRTKVPDSALK